MLDLAKCIAAFHALGIPELMEVAELHALPGGYINLLCKLPNGEMAKVLDDDRTYYGAEVCKRGSDRCYGLAVDETQLLVYEYGAEGADAELVVWKRL